MAHSIDYSSKEYLDKVDAWWRAANYLSVGQLYLKDNPLLRTPLKASDLKFNHRTLGNDPGTKYDLCSFK